MSRTLVIGEIGSTHDGRIDRARKLIETIDAAGADVAKFQFWSSAKRLAARRNAPDYLAVYEKYAMPADWLPVLKAACDARKLEFMCTAYLPEDIEVVAQYVKRFKVASFEAADEDFVDAHRGYDREIIVSTGMGARPIAGCSNLHCVSAYPAPLVDANLAVLRTGRFAGFSDHTKRLHTGAYAVAAGARIVEVHVRDWGTSYDNPDYGTALDPSQLYAYVSFIREAEAAMGDGDKRQMPSEAAMARYRVKA